MESNQCLTFFAPVLAKLFKKSKFVHLIRHPGDFVRSAIRKGWHRNDSIWESGRVRMKDHTQWSQMGQDERLARLWRVTNLYILNFKRKVKPERFITVKFEDLTANIEMAKKCILFCVSEEIDTDIILKAQNKKVNELHIHPYEPPNMKKDIEYLHFKEWDKTNKEKLKKLVGKLAHGFGYKL